MVHHTTKFNSCNNKNKTISNSVRQMEIVIVLMIVLRIKLRATQICVQQQVLATIRVLSLTSNLVLKMIN
eukprot:836701-Ditylum_brightwellii.AAC.1